MKIWKHVKSVKGEWRRRCFPTQFNKLNKFLTSLNFLIWVRLLQKLWFWVLIVSVRAKIVIVMNFFVVWILIVIQIKDARHRKSQPPYHFQRSHNNNHKTIFLLLELNSLTLEVFLSGWGIDFDIQRRPEWNRKCLE